MTGQVPSQNVRRWYVDGSLLASNRSILSKKDDNRAITIVGLDFNVDLPKSGKPMGPFVTRNVTCVAHGEIFKRRTDAHLRIVDNRFAPKMTTVQPPSHLQSNGRFY